MKRLVSKIVAPTLGLMAFVACGSDSSNAKSIEYYKQNPSEAMEKFKSCFGEMVDLEKSGVKIDFDEKDPFSYIRQKYGKDYAKECENASKVVETMK